ncbi:MAG: hypothetical protein IJV72_08090 [Clostridia bacterium]|nr:hypothetical protein [Clostridia bacterium]
MKKIKYITPELEKIDLLTEDVILASMEVSTEAYDDSDVSNESGMFWG